MNKNVKEIADRNLAGLEAGSLLWQKITLEAAEKKRTPVRIPVWKPILAGGCALAVAAAAVITVLPRSSTVIQLPGQAIVQNLSAGSDPTAPVLGVTEAPFVMGATPVDDSSLFAAQGDDGLVLMGTRAYRLTADTVPDELLGESLGRITEFTLNPSLSQGKAVSSIVACGEEVFAVRGMEECLAAARVDGVTRLLQRVSYPGHPGCEDLHQLICAPEEVESLTLNGTLYPQEEAAALVKALLSDCEWMNNGTTGNGTLLIRMQNGLTLRFTVGDETISSCGTWYCPAFFEAAGL